MLNILTATLICTGTAPTTPTTNIEVEVRPHKYSTIRYEIAEGSLQGTAYIQSIGHLEGSRKNKFVTFKSGEGPNATRLVVQMHGEHIIGADFTHYVSGMKQSEVDCEIQDDSDDDDHSGH